MLNHGNFLLKTTGTDWLKEQPVPTQTMIKTRLVRYLGGVFSFYWKVALPEILKSGDRKKIRKKI